MLDLLILLGVGWLLLEDSKRRATAKRWADSAAKQIRSWLR